MRLLRRGIRLLDENLSPRLVNRLEMLFPSLTHVRDVGSNQADNSDICFWAKNNDCGIVTIDADIAKLYIRVFSYPAGPGRG